MDDARRVGVSEGPRYLDDDVQGTIRGEGTTPEDSFQGLPFQPLQHQVDAALAVAHVEERADVGVVQVGCRLRLPSEEVL